jgi:predicted Rossmann-fold nucleotide-binding protein
MPEPHFPINPIRQKLYDRRELFAGFEYNDPLSVFDTLDFKVYRDYIDQGGVVPDSYYAGMMRSLHDYSIWHLVQKISDDPKNKIIAVMGGHKLARSKNTSYEKVAKIAWHLTRNGFICTSGGGPGAMEATHLGAHFSAYDIKDLEAAIEYLSKNPELPENLGNIYVDGKIDEEITEKLFYYLKPAYELLEKYPEGGYSFSVPTWHYGHEPATPFATEIAKYFQNSIREEGLLAIAHNGVIFSPGKAGTVQEIFQDACQNYYRSFKYFSPMVFMDMNYWENSLPVKNVLDNLFTSEENRKYLLYSDDMEEMISFLKQFKPDFDS